MREDFEPQEDVNEGDNIVGSKKQGTKNQSKVGSC